MELTNKTNIMMALLLPAVLLLGACSSDDTNCEPLQGDVSSLFPCNVYDVNQPITFSANHYVFVLSGGSSFPERVEVTGAPAGVTVTDVGNFYPEVFITDAAPDQFTLTLTGINSCGSRGPELPMEVNVYRPTESWTPIGTVPNRSIWQHNGTNPLNAEAIGKPTILPNGNEVFIMGGINLQGRANDGPAKEIYVYDTELGRIDDTGVLLPSGFDGAENGTEMCATVLPGSDFGYVYTQRFVTDPLTDREGSLWRFYFDDLRFEPVAIDFGSLDRSRNNGSWNDILFMQHHQGKIYIGPFASAYLQNGIALVVYDPATNTASKTAPFSNQFPGASGNYPVPYCSWKLGDDFYYALDNGFVMKYRPAADVWEQHDLNNGFSEVDVVAVLNDQAYMFLEEGAIYPYTFGQPLAATIGIDRKPCRLGSATNELTSGFTFQPGEAYTYNNNVHIFFTDLDGGSVIQWLTGL